MKSQQLAIVFIAILLGCTAKREPQEPAAPVKGPTAEAKEAEPLRSVRQPGQIRWGPQDRCGLQR